MDRREVQYRRGVPPQVYSGDQEAEGRKFQYVYYTDRAEDPVNAMPADKKPEDFLEWSYPLAEGSDNGARIDIEFSKTGAVSRIRCGVYARAKGSCPTLVNVHIGATEEEVIRAVGEPNRVELEDLTKTITYDDLGVVFLLERGRVYAINLQAHQSDRVFHRFLKTIF